MSKANSFIFREHTTRRALLWVGLALWLPVAARAEFDPKRPYLSAAGKQELKAGVTLTRWFEIEIKNTGTEAREAELLVFQCNGRDAGVSGKHRLEPGQIVSLPLTEEAPCSRQLRASQATTETPSKRVFVVAALMQPAGNGLSLAVKAQYLQGDNINMHSSPGQTNPPSGNSFRSFVNFSSALLMNPSSGEATVQSCSNPARDWIRFAKCNSGFAKAKLSPGAALLVVDPGPRCSLEFKTSDRAGFVHALGFEVSAGQKKHYEVDSTITFTEPKENQ